MEFIIFNIETSGESLIIEIVEPSLSLSYTGFGYELYSIIEHFLGLGYDECNSMVHGHAPGNARGKAQCEQKMSS